MTSPFHNETPTDYRHLKSMPIIPNLGYVVSSLVFFSKKNKHHQNNQQKMTIFFRLFFSGWTAKKIDHAVSNPQNPRSPTSFPMEIPLFLQEDQAIDRLHRLGQRRPVRALRFVAERTVEDNFPWELCGISWVLRKSWRNHGKSDI